MHPVLRQEALDKDVAKGAGGPNNKNLGPVVAVEVGRDGGRSGVTRGIILALRPAELQAVVWVVV